MPLWFDQVRGNYPDLGPDDCIAPDSWEDAIGHLEKTHDHHFELDGPEMRHQLEADYNLTESRIESWVKYVDCPPEDMCPRWYPKPSERQKVIAWLGEAGIKPFEYILVQWKSAELKKDYPHMQRLVEILDRGRLPVVLCHHGKLPNLGVFEAVSWPLRELGCLIQMAALTVSPDSFLSHFSSAVRTPSLSLFGPTNPKLYLKHYPLSRFLWHTDTRGKSCESTFPCYGVRIRNWWCSQREDSAPWCLEQVAPEVVDDAAYSYIDELRERGFYKGKAEVLAGDGSTLYYFVDLRVNMGSLHRVQTAPVLDSSMRKPSPVERFPCTPES